MAKMTKAEAAERLKAITKMPICPDDDDPYKTSEALHMAIDELRKDGPRFPNLHLIDKELFVSKLVNARDVIKAICDQEHRGDGFKHPIVNIIDAMIWMIQCQDEVKL